VEDEHAGYELTDAQRRVAAHRDGAMFALGRAGSGRSQALVARIAALAGDGVRPEEVLVVTRSAVAARDLRERAEGLLDMPYERLAIGTYEQVAEELLREHPVEAALDPFFATVAPADRLAILLDRVDELPLRRHEIRGNPAGLLARILRRIDAFKSEAIDAEAARRWAEGTARAASTPADRERARREIEFAELYARHDRILREGGSLDSGDLVLEGARLLNERADVHERITGRFRYVMADELEDVGVARRALLLALASHGNLVATCDELQSVRRVRAAGSQTLAALRAAFPDSEEVELDHSVRAGGAIEGAANAVAASIHTDQPAGAAADAEEVAAPSLVRCWRCDGERAQAQAAAREIEQLLAAGEVLPNRIGVIVGSGWREGRLVAGALEERSVPFRFVGDAAFFARPEVRDALAWLRMLADPNDSAAVVRALTRPPVELRSVDLARVTTIARRRKLDMVSALEAGLESPQLPPEARDRIQGFLRLYSAATGALEEIRADVFVRRLIERIGLRRHRLFAASPETAERLVSLSRLAELAATWCRREPRASTRDFIRHLTAVADAGELSDEGQSLAPAIRGAVVLAEPEQVKGLEFDHVYLLGLHRGAIAGRPWEDSWIPDELVADELPPVGEQLQASRRARLAYVAMSRAAHSLVVSWPETVGDASAPPSPLYEAVRDSLGVEEEMHSEELFGPAEGLHSTYRMIRDEVLEASWRAGSALSEMRLDTAEDVNRAIARYLELIKLAALIQRPGSESVSESIAAVGELLSRVATPEQRAALETSALDEYVIGEERELRARRDLVRSRREPSLDQFIPRRGEGLKLSASDIDLYRICPLKYKFARVFAIPQEPTINQRFGILVHQVLERFHAEEMRAAGETPPGESWQERPGSLDRLLALFEAGWRRNGFGSSDDELQYRDRAVAALTRYQERHTRAETKPVWLERRFAFTIGPHHVGGRVDRVDRLPSGGYEVIDYKTGERKAVPERAGEVQLALYRLGAREAWDVEAERGSYWYVLDDERVPVEPEPDDPERVERTVLEVAGGIEGQDFEPRPSPEICSWCDYRLICPASEA
jgi:DNA helicase-2/ATP-dependent DNA helicase PcrA